MWKQMDRVTLEREYSPSSCVDNFDELIADYSKNSRNSELQSDVLKDLSYGPGEDELLDFFPAKDNDAPLMIFIHGGYWQALSKNEATFAGSDFHQLGLAFATLDYTIAPRGSVQQMIEQCVKAIIWLFDHAERLGFSNRKIYLSGSSAGAHLAIMSAIELKDQYADLIRGIILMSGIYDLQPIVKTYINDPLNLTEVSAHQLSPIFKDLSNLPKAIICYGENETSEFKRQSNEFAEMYQSAGSACACFEVPNVNHFDIVYQLSTLWGDQNFEN